MEFNYIYTIRPKDSLKVLVAQHRGTTLFFMDPITWSRSEGDSRWSTNEMLLQIKLLFLVYVMTTLNDYPSTEGQKFLSQILDVPPFNVNLFDKWWEIERSEVLEDFATVISTVSIQQLKHFDKTGNQHVDSWFSRLIEARESGDLPTIGDSFINSQSG